MKVNFQELLLIQERVDEKMFGAAEKPSPNMIYFTMLISFFKISDSLKGWKWWKDQEQDRDLILTNLADLIGLFLSYMNQSNYKDLTQIDKNFELVFKMYSNFTQEQILESIAIAFDSDIEQPPEAILIASIFLVNKNIETNWDEITDFYMRRSQEKITRQS